MNSLKLWPSLLNKLQNHRTYIIPSKLGVYYGLFCLILLAVAFIFGNNITYFCCFTFASIGFVTMFQTNFNMTRLRLRLLPIHDSYAEQPVRLQVMVENISSQPLHQIAVRIRGTALSFDIPFIAPNSHEVAEFSYIFERRGYHRPPIIVAETEFPYGLLYSWKILRPEQSLLIYPAKKGALVLPASNQEGIEEPHTVSSSLQRGDDFVGHRPFAQHDSYRHIDWKAYARNQKLNVKLFESEARGTQILSWSSLNANLSVEDKLSQLTQWIDICVHNKFHFVLDIPQWKSAAKQSSEHVKDCLTHLALFEDKGSEKRLS